MDETEIIYILTNPAMPGYVKIGKTDRDLETRMREFDGTATPLPFECFFAAKVRKRNDIEKRLHEAFGVHRLRPSREFFEIDPDAVASALRIADILEDVTPREEVAETEEDKVALREAKRRQPPFNFHIVDVPVGAELTLTHAPEITCRVAGRRSVEFGGKETSLNQATLSAMATLGYEWKAVQGPQYWKYEGETLVERRKRMEEE